MAHVQEPISKLWKPENLASDKLDSQKIFIDNTDMIEALFKEAKQVYTPQVANITALKAIDTTNTNIFIDGKIINVLSNGQYQFLRSSTATSDDINYVTPTTGGGRWASLSAVQQDLVKLPLSGSTATAITVAGFAFINMNSMRIKIAADNNGSATTINGKRLYIPGTTNTPKTKANRVIEVWYESTGDCFFIKASASGNAIAADVLATKTFSNDDDTDLVGTMVNRGAISQSLAVNGTYTIPKGYHNGSGQITQSLTTKAATTITPGTADQVIAANQYLTGAQTVLGDADLVSANIKAGANIFNVAGKTEVVDTTEATNPASASQILTDKIGFVNGAKITGTMVNRTGLASDALAYAVNDTKIYLRPPEGYYPGLSGSNVTLDAPTLISANIKAGTNILGITGKTEVVDTTESVAPISASHILAGKVGFVNGAKITGSMTSKFATTYTPGITNQVIASNQYLAGAQTIKGDADLVSANIKAGVDIFGVAGKTEVVDTTEATNPIAAGNILSGKVGFVNGAKITGGVAVKSGNVGAPYALYQDTVPGLQVCPPQGYYPQGEAYIAVDDPDFVAENFLATKNIFGLQGSIPIKTLASVGDYIAPKSIYTNGDGNLYVEPNTGYYHDGLNYTNYGDIKINDPDFVASNFLETKNIFGLQGSIPVVLPDTADQYQALSVSQGGGHIYLQIQPNTYHKDINWIRYYDPDYIAANILETKNIFGLQGSIPVYSSGNQMALNYGAENGTVYLTAPVGYFNGSCNVYASDPDFTAANILAGKNIFGLDGTAPRLSKGTFTSTSATITIYDFGGTSRTAGVITVTGLPAAPKFILVDGGQASGYSSYLRTTTYFRNDGGVPGYGTVNGIYGPGVISDVAYETRNTNVYVNSNSFSLPIVASAGITYNWYAFY